MIEEEEKKKDCNFFKLERTEKEKKKKKKKKEKKEEKKKKKKEKKRRRETEEDNTIKEEKQKGKKSNEKKEKIKNVVKDVHDSNTSDERMHNTTKNNNNSNNRTSLSSSSSSSKKRKRQQDLEQEKEQEQEENTTNNDDDKTNSSKDVYSKKNTKKRKNLHDDDSEGSCSGSGSGDDKRQKKQRKKKKEEKKEKKSPSEKEAVIGHEHSKYKTTLLDTCDHKQEEEKKQEEKLIDSSNDPRVVESSAMDYANNGDNNDNKKDDNMNNITLLLFYQYVEPPWTNDVYKEKLIEMEQIGNTCGVTGRMRVAKEGLNCTLTGSRRNILQFCTYLRQTQPEFQTTEFKLTNHLPIKQKFSNLKIMPVIELVNYGLDGVKNQIPEISKYQGVHLEPKEYHKKIAESNTVIIDVRNHYEANIGRFQPPKPPPTTISNADNNHSNNKRASTDENKASGCTTTTASNNLADTNGTDPGSAGGGSGSAVYLDPKMRKSTEFPLWLDKPEVKEMLRDKQVLMYCTGGIRCERASALLKYKMKNDSDTASLGIKGVYQLQGGIDKYFKEFPDGGYWKGKNYVFDKRFSHAPPVMEHQQRKQQQKSNMDEKEVKTKQGKKTKRDKKKENEDDSHDNDNTMNNDDNLDHENNNNNNKNIMGNCESCQKPWDMFRGKRRCPTCGVPSLICFDCAKEIKEKRNRNDAKDDVRCDLCVEQNITSKHQLRQLEQTAQAEYEQKLQEKGLLPAAATTTNIGNHHFHNNKKQKRQQLSPKNMNNNNLSSAATPVVVSTRLFCKNMCRDNMTEELLLETIPNITHIVWRYDRKHDPPVFTGQGWIEMRTIEDAKHAVERISRNTKVCGRTLYIDYQKPNPKDVWPPPSSRVV